MSATSKIINVSLLAYVYISILCLVYVLPFKLINQSLLQAQMSYVSLENHCISQIWHFSCFTFNQRYNLQRKNWNHKSSGGP